MFVKKIILIVFAVILLNATASFAEEKQQAGKPEGAWSFLLAKVATVDGYSVSRDEFVSFSEGRGVSAAEINSRNSDGRKALAKELLDHLANQIILANLATAAGFKVSPELVAKNLDAWLKSLPPDEKKQFEAQLASQKMTLEAYRKEISGNIHEQRQAAIAEWSMVKIKPDIKVSDKEVREFYESKADLIKASHILLKPENNSAEAMDKTRKEANALLQKIKDGADFNTVAASSSSCGSPELGEFGRGQMVQEFDDVAFKLKPGEISDVVQTPFGLHIIKVTAKSKRQLPPFDEIKNALKDELTALKAENEVFALLKKAKQNADIKISPQS
jgi:peptidyl-prolyl cis-trans isomerase C